eukprot:2116422-Rhodomonas_salina.1
MTFVASVSVTSIRTAQVDQCDGAGRPRYQQPDPPYCATRSLRMFGTDVGCLVTTRRARARRFAPKGHLWIGGEQPTLSESTQPPRGSSGVMIDLHAAGVHSR